MNLENIKIHKCPDCGCTEIVEESKIHKYRDNGNITLEYRVFKCRESLGYSTTIGKIKSLQECWENNND